jgi:hypothetical protein
MCIPETGRGVHTASVKFDSYRAAAPLSSTPRSPSSNPPTSPKIAPVAPLIRDMARTARTTLPAPRGDDDDSELDDF